MLKADETSGKVLFEEKQKFPGWLTILVAGIILVTIVIIFIVGLTGPQEERKEMWTACAVTIPIEILIIILEKGIERNFRLKEPFHSPLIIDYSPLHLPHENYQLQCQWHKSGY